MLTIIHTPTQAYAFNLKPDKIPNTVSIEVRERKDVSPMRGRVKQSNPTYKIEVN